jgi:hypothetical protein
VANNPINWIDPSGKVCGEGISDKIIEDKPGGFDFTDACAKHDQCCACTGKRKKCEDEFYNNMKKVCEKEKNWLKRTNCYTLAGIYAKAARFCKKNDKDCNGCSSN